MVFELILIMLLGLAVGSFLTLAVERFDTMEAIVHGRSHCNHCRKPLTWWELIPLLGYFLVRGKCNQCRKAIPRTYPFYEALTAVVFALIYVATPQPIHYGVLALELVFVSGLIFLWWYDWINQTFPATVLYAVLGGAVLLLATKVWWTPTQLYYFATADPLFAWLSTPSQPLAASILGGIVGFALLGVLAFPSKGQWMGYGDVILVAILGLWLGYPLIFVAVLLAFYLGAGFGLWHLAKQRVREDHRLAFGPFLILGSIITYVWGEALFAAMMRLWGVA